MRVAIIGASGFIGAYVRDEALARGHRVTAIVRRPEKITAQNPNLAVVNADILKARVDELLKGHDAVISAYSAGRSGPDIYNEQIKGYKAIIGGVKKWESRDCWSWAGPRLWKSPPAWSLSTQ